MNPLLSISPMSIGYPDMSFPNSLAVLVPPEPSAFESLDSSSDTTGEVYPEMRYTLPSSKKGSLWDHITRALSSSLS